MVFKNQPSHPMKTRFLALLPVVLFFPLQAQEENAPAPEADVPAWQMKLDNLPPEQKQTYYQHLAEASRLFNQKRVFESLNQIGEAEKILKVNPYAMNLKGACYVEFRNFVEARKHFDEALALSPDNPRVLFNLVEMDFVTKQWESCAKRIKSTLPLLDEKTDLQLHRLLEFKLLLAYLKLEKDDEARAIEQRHDYLEDTPFHYFANAALQFHAGEEIEAEAWLGRARRVFRQAAMLAPWQDTLIEYGYIKSFYGEDLARKLAESLSLPDSPPQSRSAGSRPPVRTGSRKSARSQAHGTHDRCPGSRSPGCHRRRASACRPCRAWWWSPPTSPLPGGRGCRG